MVPKTARDDTSVSVDETDSDDDSQPPDFDIDRVRKIFKKQDAEMRLKPDQFCEVPPAAIHVFL